MVRPALKEVRRDLKVQWYRCFLGKGVLTELQRRSDVYGAIQSIIPLLVWISTAKLVLGADSMATLAISLILHGTIGSTFVYACHELGHGTVFKTAILNKVRINASFRNSRWLVFDSQTPFYCMLGVLVGVQLPFLVGPVHVRGVTHLSSSLHPACRRRSRKPPAPCAVARSVASVATFHPEPNDPSEQRLRKRRSTFYDPTYSSGGIWGCGC